jgi:hypothetical protein
MLMHIVTPLNSNVATAEEKRKKRESKESMRVQRLSGQGFVVGTRLLDTRSDHLISPMSRLSIRRHYKVHKAKDHCQIAHHTVRLTSATS